MPQVVRESRLGLGGRATATQERIDRALDVRARHKALLRGAERAIIDRLLDGGSGVSRWPGSGGPFERRSSAPAARSGSRCGS